MDNDAWFKKSHQQLADRVWLEGAMDSMSVNEIAKDLAVPRFMVAEAIKRHGIKQTRKRFSCAIIGQDGVRHSSKKDAMKAMGCTEETLWNSLISGEVRYEQGHDEALEARKVALSTHPDLNDEFIRKWFNEERRTMAELSTHVGMRLPLLSQRARLAGVDPSRRDISTQMGEDAMWVLWSPDLLRELHEHLNDASIAKMIGVTESTVSSYRSRYGVATIPRRQSSQREREFVAWIQSIVPDLEVMTNVRGMLPNRRMELDVYIPDLSMAFEFNGTYWHQWDHAKKLSDKSTMASGVGIHLVHIQEYLWVDPAKRRILERKIHHLINRSTQRPIMARKCTIGHPTHAEHARFMDQNHIQGNLKRVDFIVGLKHGSEWVAMMSFFRNQLERYATSCAVTGGGSRLLSHAMKHIEGDIHTYANRLYSYDGQNIYTRMGFKEAGITPPGYVWVHPSTMEVRSRQQCQRHKLTGEGTEAEIMQSMGFVKSHDAGHIRYVLERGQR